MNQHVSRQTHKPFAPARKIVEEALHFADKAGWPARLTNTAEGESAFELEVAGNPLSVDPLGTFRDCRTDRQFSLPLPWEAAILAFEAAVPCTSGHATVLAPVGQFGSPASAGAIDSVILAQHQRHPVENRANWSLACATVSHTRCWIINLSADCHGLRNPLPDIGDGSHLTILPEWMAVRDTAALCEYARDCGWADARYPQVVALEFTARATSSGAKVSAWLAVTDAASSVSLAERIGAISAPLLSSTERRQKLVAALGTGRIDLS